MLAKCGTAGVHRWGRMCDLICNDRTKNASLLCMACQSLDRDITWAEETSHFVDRGMLENGGCLVNTFWNKTMSNAAQNPLDQIIF